MKTFKAANLSFILAGVSLGTPVFAHSDEIVCGTTYVVERADSLSNISEWAYGTARRVDEIYAANADTIGPDPAALLIGMVLNIPCIEGEELVAGASNSDTETATAAEAEALAAAEAVAAAEAQAAEALAEAALPDVNAEATAELAAAEAEAAAKAAELEAAAQTAEVEEDETQAIATSDADSTEDLMAMSGELLTVEGFDAEKVVALIDTLDIPADVKTTLSNAVVAAQDNPVWLRGILTNISNHMGL